MDAADEFVKDCKNTFDSVQSNKIGFWNSYEDTDTMALVEVILDTIFNIIIIITMFLCLFSLVSSMSANLFDQTKEIGILRAMGFTKYRIKLLYFYEAFILVIVISAVSAHAPAAVRYYSVWHRRRTH